MVLRLTLQDAMKTLRRRKRQAYALWAAGNSAGDVAAAPDITKKNCYAALERMRAALREALQINIT